ncbi:hypothetical protein BDF14DRAFT_1743601 [Spinellus fusiger]|nr:hypothetical protein BDF14DRAFT_1743601 [Spinellus fusiger]
MATQYTVNDLLPKIHQNIDAMDYTMAYTFCKRALEMEPNNADILEVAGQVEMELSLFTEARQHMLAAIHQSPEVGYKLEAIQAFQKGVELMTAERNTLAEGSKEAHLISFKIANALCSMTEIYLTDCCFEPEAEQKCEDYLQQAQQMDPENSEVYQLLASVRLSQTRNEEAVVALEQSMNLWINKEFGDPAIPIYDSRLALVKLQLEMGMFPSAFTVLEGLQKENDQVVDLWYLYGWAYYCLGEDDSLPGEERQAHWEDARDCLELAVKLYKTVGTDDEAMVEHANELIGSINAVVPPSAPEDETIAEDAEIDYEDEDEEDDTAMEM